MPPSLRNRAPALDQQDTDSEVELSFTGHRAGQDDMLGDDGEEDDDDLVGDDENDDEPPGASQTPLPNIDPPPSYLREISTLASWTVSSSKPGCSVPQLRHPSTSLFWQSDGPQPHYLNIHFFKLVRIVGLRLYLDFEQDESYTPTRIVFLAGSGMNDLQEWSEMKLESPRGWIWADFSNVGDPEHDDGDGDGDDDEDDTQMYDPIPLPITTTTTTTNTNTNTNDPNASSDSENNMPQHHHQTPQNTYTHPQPTPTPTLTYTSPQPSSLSRPHPRHPFTSLSTHAAPSPHRHPHPHPHMPVLRAHLVQIKILENHQNGKDTHLRGLEVFARNDEQRDAGKRGAEEHGARTWELGLGLGLGELEAGGIR